MSTRLFLLVTDDDSNDFALVGLAHVKTITPDRKSGCASIDMGENGILTRESFEDVARALGVELPRR